jgi:hypothetical protein
VSAPFLCFQKAFVFVGGGAADIAGPCQFADVQLPVFVSTKKELIAGFYCQFFLHML